MRWLFSFEGRVGRVAYALAATAVFFTPHLIALAAWAANGAPPGLTAWFWLAPMRWLTTQGLSGSPMSPILPLGGMVLTVVGAWVAAALAVRRARDTNASGWLAALVIAPVLQIPAILLLMALPGRPADDGDVRLDPRGRPRVPPAWTARLQGLLAGVAITLFAVALGALVFGSYGFTMFISAPLVIGATTGFIGNRRGDIGGKHTIADMTASMAVAGLALLAVALEGVICLALAFPLAWLMGLIGAMVGRAAAGVGRPGAATPLMSLVLLPVLFLSEQVVPAATPFSDERSVVVAASPEETWQAVLHMRTIDAAPAIPFRLGVAYPVRGEVTGEGVGAIRRGYFSTGVATERVTEWVPGRALGFDILSEPETLREMSPYAHVHAPHVKGYFRSVHARIVLTPLADGRTRLTLASTHELDLQPSFYWLPLTRWVVRENKARVLTQMKAQAEAAAVRSKS